MRKTKGFTLAEVLITLVIIGIIAAMTIPTMRRNINNQEKRSRFVKIMSAVNQAVKLEHALYGNVTLYPDGTPLGRDRIMSLFQNNFSVVSIENEWGDDLIRLADGTKIKNLEDHGFIISFAGDNEEEIWAYCSHYDCNENEANTYSVTAWCGEASGTYFCPTRAVEYAYMYGMSVDEAVNKLNLTDDWIANIIY